MKFGAMAPPPILAQAIEEYLGLTEAVSGLLEAQAKMDVESLAAAMGKRYPDSVVTKLVESQYRAYRNTFLVLGMDNQQFLQFMSELSPDSREHIIEKAQTYK